MATSAPEAKFTTLTVKDAAFLLENNDVNRQIRTRNVNSYAKDMEMGLWRSTGEPIKVSRTGRLLDGQHRLTAQILAGIDMEYLMVSGLDDKAQSLMDQGAARTATDAARLAGIKNGAFATSIARWILLAPEPHGTMDAALRAKASTAQILAALERCPDIEHAAEHASSLRPHLPGSPTAVGYCWLLMNRVDHTDCKLFYDSYVDLTFKALRDPRKAVLKRLTMMNNEAGYSAGKDKAMATVSMLTRGWNAWRRGEEMESIMLRNNKGKIIAPVAPV